MLAIRRVHPTEESFRITRFGSVDLEKRPSARRKRVVLPKIGARHGCHPYAIAVYQPANRLEACPVQCLRPRGKRLPRDRNRAMSEMHFAGRGEPDNSFELFSRSASGLPTEINMVLVLFAQFIECCI
jgi:hypothetical protein